MRTLKGRQAVWAQAPRLWHIGHRSGGTRRATP